MNISTMARAYSYIRFSTPKQAEGDSFRRQTELSEEYALKQGLVFDRSLNLHDKGLSAFSGDNRTKGALAVFLKAVENGIVKRGSYLLIESFDRLSRDTLSAQMTLFMALVNAGITVITLTDEQVYSKETIDKDISRLMLSLVIMMRSHEESLMKSRRLVATWEQKRQGASVEKLTSLCPHWLELNPDRKSFRVLDDRVKIVRRIFQMCMDGIGQGTIAKTLNKEGVAAWGRGNGWHPSYVQRLLGNPAVIGEYQPQRRATRGKLNLVPAGDPLKDYYPAVIDMPTWQRVQMRRQTSTPGRVNYSHGNLFSGLAFDGYSGAPLRHMKRGRNISAKSRKGKDAQDYKRYYYLVSDYQRLHPDAKAISWRYEWFEKWFLDYVTGLDWRSITQEKSPIAELGLEKKLAAAQKILDDLGLKLGRLAKLAQSTDHPPASILDDMNKLECAMIAEKNKELELAKELEVLVLRRVALTEAATEFKDLIAAGDSPARMRLREEIRRRISRIDVYPNGAEPEHLKGEPVTQAPGMPAFKISFTNGATRWVFCDSKRPVADGAAVLTGPPPATDLELRDQPEVVYGDQKAKRGKVLVEVFVAAKQKLSDKKGKSKAKR
jgi:DNA invertase Pin-like site-specific DNA recombinase